jgi:hypothetical protein
MLGWLAKRSGSRVPLGRVFLMYGLFMGYGITGYWIKDFVLVDAGL